ncbi:MAG: biotin synthase BioB, partial [Elusimicrobiota bacterium]
MPYAVQELVPGALHHDWSMEELEALHAKSLPDLIFLAQQALRAHHDASKVQLCTLLSVKTGGCAEDCGYCPQSAHHEAPGISQGLLEVDEVLAKAREAKAAGSARFCMGAAWREVQDGGDFDRVLEMVRGVSALGLETCCTLGMLTQEQARKLADAGLHAYNHNLDTSPEYYGKIVSTRGYQDRLDTLDRVDRAGITLCSGGIIGMGESLTDRLRLLQTLANRDPHPASVPINALVRVAGTPLQDAPPLKPFELARMIALARVLM